MEQRHAKTITSRKWRKDNPDKLAKYKITTREWRKDNPDKIKAQKKRYSAVRKERLVKQPKAVVERFYDLGTKRGVIRKAKSPSPPTALDPPLRSDSWGVRSDAGVKRGSYRLQEFTSKLESVKYPSEQDQWRTVMSSRDIVGSSMFPAFLKGFGKIKPVVRKKEYVPEVNELKPTVGLKMDGSRLFEFSVFRDYKLYKAGIRKATKGQKHLSLKARAKIAKDAKPVILVKVPKKKRKFGFGYAKKKRKSWLDAHPTHSRSFLGFGSIFGGLASYTFWNRGKK